MKIAVVCCHSVENRALAELTALNRWKYSARHGYDLLTFRRPYPEMARTYLEEMRHALGNYDVLLHIGSDVVITNPAIRIEDIVLPSDNVVFSAEIEGRAAFNNDIGIWSSTPLCKAILADASSTWKEWVDREGSWQQVLIDNPIGIRVVPPRVLNSTDQSGDWRWQPGDFLCHCLGGTTESKIERLQPFLEYARTHDS